MCGMILAMIVFVLGPFKFLVTLNSFERCPRTPILFLELCHIAHYHPVVVLWLLLVLLLFGLFFFCFFFYDVFQSLPSIFHIPHHPVLLYNKETVSRTLSSLSASAFRVAATGADIALYNFEIVFLKNEFIFLLIYF